MEKVELTTLPIRNRRLPGLLGRLRAALAERPARRGPCYDGRVAALPVRAMPWFAAAALVLAAPARAVSFDLTLLGGAAYLGGFPGAWTGEVYSGSLSPTPTGTTLFSTGSAGASGGWGIQLSIGIPLPSDLTFGISGLYEALLAEYRPGTLQFTPQSADLLAGPMSLGIVALPLQLRWESPVGYSIFAGGGPAVSSLGLLVASPAPETDFEARAVDVDLRLGGDFVLARWGHEKTFGVAAGLVAEADTDGWAKAVFLTLRLFSGAPNPTPSRSDDDG